MEQVKDLGGSPARMLFVLNRIDIFQEDRNPIETEHRFVTDAVLNIKKELTEQLKEYTEEIENLQVWSIIIKHLPILKYEAELLLNE